MSNLSQKLKSVKLKLKEWNKYVFGNFNDNVMSAMEELDYIQQQGHSSGFNDDL